MKKRVAQIKRATKETQISLKLNIDGAGKSSIKAGIPFFDHLLTLRETLDRWKKTPLPTSFLWE